MPDRKHPLAICEECPFYEQGGYVPTLNLNPQSGLAVVGEAPGSYEAVHGIPFTGPSGRLLNQVLNHHGIRREDVMLTNIAACRPPDNADPPKAAVAACKPRLDAELAGVSRILAVGGIAASNLIDTTKKITTLRVGAPKPYLENPDIEVVATWHPAYCLRSADAFPSFVSDVGKINGYKINDWVEPRYRVFDDLSMARRAVEQLSSLDGPLVIDIECGVDKDVSYVHPDHYDLLCVGVAFGADRAVVFADTVLRDHDFRTELRNLFLRKRLIAHNGKFDLNGLFPVLGRLELFADTMLMSYAYDERPGQHGLKKLSIEILGAPDWEAVIKKYIPRGGNYANIPRDILYKYNAYDVAATWRLWEHFNNALDDRGKKQHAFLVSASNAIMGLERNGISLDEHYNEKLAQEFVNDLNDIEIELSRITNRDINPRSPMQIQRYFLEKGLQLPSTEADLLVDVRPNLSGEVGEFIDTLLLHRKQAKLYGTYVKGFANRVYKGKIFTTYTLHGTTSGRLASKAPNLQNIVRDKRIKHQFTVEDEDCTLVHCDFKQAEGRVITTLARDDYLASIFRDPNKDIFNDLCTQVYGENNWGKEERVKIKSVFYGLSYGRGAQSIAAELKITLAESRELLTDFKALIPATVAWQAAVTHRVLTGEDLTTPFGRKRSFWLITEKNRTDVINEALSYLPQSIASDICLTALIRLQKTLGGMASLRLTIHDALVAECRDRDKDEVIALMTQEMINAGSQFTDFVPFAVDATFGKRWSEL